MRPTHGYRPEYRKNLVVISQSSPFTPTHASFAGLQRPEAKEVTKLVRQLNIVKGIGYVHPCQLDGPMSIYLNVPKRCPCRKGHRLRIREPEIGEPCIRDKTLLS
jgi:hypothetical protein